MKPAYLKTFITLLFFAALFLRVESNLYAQKQGRTRLDSLLIELPKMKEDTNKVKVYGTASSILLYINPDSSIQYAKLGLELSEKLYWKKGIAAQCSRLGATYNVKGDYPKAIEFQTKSLHIYEEIGLKDKVAGCLGNIGGVFSSQADYKNALNYFNRSLKNYEDLGDTSKMASISIAIAAIYEQLGNKTEALNINYRVLKLFEGINNKFGTALSLTHIAGLFG